MTQPYRLLGCRGCGSFLAEAAFRLADIPYEYEEVDYNEPGPARDRLFALNPLPQLAAVAVAAEVERLPKLAPPFRNHFG